MHRFGKAEILDEECRIPEGFDLEKEIASGFADFAGGGEPIRLEFLCEESSAAYLEETPLSEDQEIAEAEEGWVRINATVNDTWQLRWWLLSKGSGIEVIAPENLRKEIAEELEAASSYYAHEENSELMKAARAASERVNAFAGKFEKRDPARIPVMLDAIREQWEKDPDLRLSQLIVNALSPSEPCPQVYYFEDEQLISKLI